MRGVSALEDVPMVIPIAVSLIIFFSALAWAMNHVDDTNRAVDTVLTALRVADTFSDVGVITDGDFDDSCKALEGKTGDFYFIAYIASPDNYGVDPNTSLDAVCSTHSLCCAQAPNDVLSISISRLRENGVPVYVRAFPVTYQDTTTSVPVNDVNTLVVIVWPKE